VPIEVATGTRDQLRWFGGRVAWALLANVASQGTAFGVAVANARLLGHSAFGRLAILQSVAISIAALAAAGLGVTATKVVASMGKNDPGRVGRVLGLCTLVTGATGGLFSVLCLVAAPSIARLFNIVGLEWEVRLASIQLLFLTLNTFQVGALSGFSAFPSLARIGLIQGALALALSLFASSKFGITGAVLAAGLAAATSWAFHQSALRRECKARGIVLTFTHLRREAGVLWRWALPAAASGWIGGLAITTANALVVRQPDGYASLAIFNASSSVRVAVLFVPALVARVSTSVLCGLAVRENSAAYRHAYYQHLVITIGAAAMAAAGLAAVGPWVLLLFGRDFTGGASILGVLLCATVLEASAAGLYQAIVSSGRIWLQVGITTAWGGCLVFLAVLLARTHGAMALAIAYLGAWATAVVLYVIVSRMLMYRPSSDHDQSQDHP